MTETIDTREKLQQRIHEKKSQIRTFLSKIEPPKCFAHHHEYCVQRFGRAINGGSCGWRTVADPGAHPSARNRTTAPSWRLLCAAATIFFLYWHDHACDLQSPGSGKQGGEVAGCEGAA